MNTFNKPWNTIDQFLEIWFQEPRLPQEHQQIFDRYYKRFQKGYSDYLRFHYASQVQEITHLITPGSSTLLEIGSGCGTEALWFALNGAKVVSIDISEDRLACARARKTITEEMIGDTLDLEFRDQSVFDLSIDQDFDLIWMEQTFHHVEPREQFYTIVSRLLKPGGHLVISEANAWNPLLQLQLFKQRGFKTKVQKKLPNGEVVEYGNERITFPSVLVKNFRQAGIETITSRYYRTLPNWPFLTNGKAGQIALKIESGLPSKMFPFLFTHYNYVGRKSA